MGKSESLSFSDISGYSSSETLVKHSSRTGCFVTVKIGTFIVFLFICVAVAVGLIVYYTKPENTTDCGSTSLMPSGTTQNPVNLQSCMSVIQAERDTVCSICNDTSSALSTSTLSSSSSLSSSSMESSLSSTTMATTTPQPPDQMDIRLPSTLRPFLYSLEIQPNIYSGQPSTFTFNGSVNISMTCLSPTDVITLNILNVEVSGFEVEPLDYMEGAVSYLNHTIDASRQLIFITVSRNFTAGGNYSLKIGIAGKILPDLKGLYLSSYTSGNVTSYIATTQFQPTDLRKVFPCFDEPAFKAVFEVTILRKSHMISLSNMPSERQEDRGDGWVAESYYPTPIMSSYLLALVVCDFDYIEAVSANGVQIKTWSRPDAINQSRYASDLGVSVFNYFQDYFDIPYPLPKLGQIAVPDFSFGGMENWGLIVYREIYMLYDPEQSSETVKQSVANIVSHEMAHQWFGNLVTMAWWDDLWLNEGFATYFAYVGMNHYHPEWRIFEFFDTNVIQKAMQLDGMLSSHPVYMPIRRPQDIDEIFDAISYQKGASIIRMMEYFLGKDVFQEGLQNYLRHFSYNVTFHDDLWSSMENQLLLQNRTLDVKAIMDTWILQMNYPVVTFTYLEGRLYMRQKRYLVDYTAIETDTYISPYNYTWIIPITYTTRSQMNFNQSNHDIIWMYSTNESVETNITGGDWIIGNIQAYGYFRVNYDLDNWNKIIAQLDNDHTAIHVINRAQLINDAWSLAKSGDLDTDIAFRTSNYLDKEMDYIPLQAATTELSYVNLLLRRTSIYGSFLTFMRNTFEQKFSSSVLNDRPTSHIQSYFNSLIAKTACSYQIPDCISESKDLFKEFMQNSTINKIPTDVRASVYCTAIKHGGVAEWDFAFEMSRKENVVADRGNILVALACTDELWLLNRYIGYASDSTKIHSSLALSVIYEVSKNVIGNSIVWRLLEEKWDVLYPIQLVQRFSLFTGDLYTKGAFVSSNLYEVPLLYIGDVSREIVEVDRFGGTLMEYLLQQTTQSYNTQYELQMVEEFIASRTYINRFGTMVKQATEQIETNIKWMSTNYPKAVVWLAD